MSKYEKRVYDIDNVAYFCKTAEIYGGLSNMAAGFYIHIGDSKILTSEALYQACRYPDYPDIQKSIITQSSPMTAKKISRKEISKCRDDWNNIRVIIMKWVLRVKLIQNWDTFSELLESTGNKSIVEMSTKDDFWGCFKNGTTLVGTNALGRLLMELREFRRSKKGQKCLLVNPPKIDNFMFLNEPIGAVPRSNSRILQKKLL
jgi:ribA/ribD-fused uncharacterized protein